MSNTDRLRDRYQFKAGYIPNYEEFRDKIYKKTIIPYQKQILLNQNFQAGNINTSFLDDFEYKHEDIN